MKEILVIIPVMDAYERAVKLIKKRGYRNVDVVFGSMSGGLQRARNGIREGAKIIVARGGTYQLIKENLNIPTVEIKVSAFDVIDSISQIEHSEETIGVVGYNSVVSGFDTLEKILPYNFVKIELKNEDDIYDVIEKHKKMGIKTYIGDSNITRIIENLSCRGIIISSQDDSILNAIQEARRISNAIKTERRHAQQISNLTDFVHDAIIAIDTDEIITTFNHMSEIIFGISQADAIGKKIEKTVPNTGLPWLLSNPEPKLGQIQNIGNLKLAVNGAPIIIDTEVKGAVATFQDITELQEMEQKIRRKLSKIGFSAKYTFDDIVYKSPLIEKCIETAKSYAEYDSPILISGTSGVGKELFCQSIHNFSPRKNGPFIAINCAAIPPSLIESEFFGYEEGSFTGASRNGKAGIFELAHKGTIFLDEISEIPKDLQGRLLRVLQEKQVMRIGGNKVIPVDIKIICASNQNLREMMNKDLFRKDLYFRISILTLSIPSLNERKEDIIELAKYFIQKYSIKHNKQPLELTFDVKDYLLNYKYEGNVRELEGLIERSIILSSFEGIFNTDLNYETQENTLDDTLCKFAGNNLDLRTVEKAYIKTIYEKTYKNLKQTCDILKIDRSTLWRKLKEINNS